MTKREISRLIETYGSDVYGFCCHLTGNKMEADDLYQETFLKVFERRNKLQKEGNPRSYILGVAVRIWQNQRKVKENRQRIVPLQEYKEEKICAVRDAKGSPEDEVLRRELKDQVRSAVAALPEKIRVVVYLFYTAELSVRQIADMLDIPEGTVKSRLSAGRKMTRDYLEGKTYGRENNG